MVVQAPPMLEVQTVAVPCSNERCLTRDGNRHIIMRLVGKLEQIVIFQRCRYCGHHNVRQIRDGEIVQ